MSTITKEQYILLAGFKLHIWNVYHNRDNSKPESDFWAELLDKAKIPWSIQNDVSCLMETRANGFSSLATLLKSKGHEVCC